MKHHFVPQFALRYWAEADGRVPYFARIGRQIVRGRVAPEYTGFEPDLYAFNDVDGDRRHLVEEEFFKKLDNAAAPIYARMEQREPNLSAEERIVWATFLMAANARVPEKIELAKQIANKHVRQALAERPEEYLAVRGDAVEPTVLDWVESNLSGIENLGLVQMVKFLSNERHVREFLELEWIVHSLAHANVQLLLGDRPLWTKGRPSDPEFIAMMPLSPRSVFVASRSKRAIQRTIDAKPNILVRRMNESIAAYAMLRVYGRATEAFIDRCMRQPEDLEEAVKKALDGPPRT